MDRYLKLIEHLILIVFIHGGRRASIHHEMFVDINQIYLKIQTQKSLTSIKKKILPTHATAIENTTIRIRRKNEKKQIQ